MFTSALRLVRDGPPVPYAQRPQLAGPAKAYEYLRPFAEKEPTEVFWLLPLDAHYRLVTDAPIEIARGTSTAVPSEPREILRAALLAGADFMIVAHNHPSGDPTPSKADKGVTAALGIAGEQVGISLLDHIVIGDTGYESIISIMLKEVGEDGLLDKLATSLKAALRY